MKGIVHFVSGLAAASCFPQAVDMAYRESSFILAWGGIFGILPDTLDFKFAQFFEEYDYVVDPDPENPDPQGIANTVAKAIHQAHESKKTCSVMLMTIKKGADLWRQYRVLFDPENNKVTVRIGPLVNTSKKPYSGTELSKGAEGEARLNCALAKEFYEKDVEVDIMTGPSFCFVPQEDGKVKMDFIHWHRRWSHSLILGAFLGIGAWLVLGIFWGWDKSSIYGMVIIAAFWVHVLEDQLGHMGNNLFWPFTSGKTVGLKAMHSGDAWPNFMTVWLALVLIFYNLNEFAPEPVFDMPVLVYCAYAAIIPLALVRIVESVLKRFESTMYAKDE